MARLESEMKQRYMDYEAENNKTIVRLRTHQREGGDEPDNLFQRRATLGGNLTPGIPNP